MLYVISLGLGDEKDITVKGLETIRKCSRVMLEMYTSVLGVDTARLEEFYGKKIEIADRTCVESEADRIYGSAKDEDVAFLVVGDAFCATTHTDLVLRCKELGVPVEVIPNASVMGAVGCCGLQLYSYGQTVSIPFFTDEWRPDSFYPKIKFNRSGGLHTLCLLDIKVKEPDFKAMAKGVTRFLPPRFMTVAQCAQQLLEVEQTKGEGVYGPETVVVGMARLGQTTQAVVACTLAEMAEYDLGAPLHCLVIPGEMHCLEQQFLEQFRLEDGAPWPAAVAE